MFGFRHRIEARAKLGTGARAGTVISPALTLVPIVGGIVVLGTSHVRGAPPRVLPNRNVEAAGVLHGGVLTVALEAKETRWWLHGPRHPAMTVAAFSEAGKAPLLPGPLLRVPAKTAIRLSVRNSLATPLTFFVPAAIHGGPELLEAADSIVVPPGALGQFTVRATVPGNYVYRATTPAAADRVTKLDGLMAGALVVDSAGAPARPRDRVFVIMTTPDSASTAYLDTLSSGVPRGGLIHGVFTINGEAWPNTERISATVGDSLHWRVINASAAPHPMHLHGFYYRVDAINGPADHPEMRAAPGQMVVTQLLRFQDAMTMTWSPDRPGNWIFHCHFAIHLMPDSLSAAPDDPDMRGMVGLILGVNVSERAGVRAAGEPAAVRHLRLVAVADSSAPLAPGVRQALIATGTPLPVPAMRFILEDNGRRVDTKRAISPELDLVRGEPISITIVNRLSEPTSVHWHGIEVEDSYVDGVPGVSGEGTHLAPAIAPGDSFQARFTPPRSGTFMYHAHVDEVREQQGGLEGAIIVHDRDAPADPDDHVFLLKGNHLYSPAHPTEINGMVNPDTVVIHAGRAARFRLINLATTSVVPSFSLTARPDSALNLERDTMVVRWTPIAKDGFDLPPVLRASRPADQLISMGETYDFEFTPQRKGVLRLEVRSQIPRNQLKIRVPIRVE
jgi:FtsP/CotA-like multicopper oxidase with cupredoxin domain